MKKAVEGDKQLDFLDEALEQKRIIRTLIRLVPYCNCHSGAQIAVTIWRRFKSTEDHCRATEKDSEWQQPFGLTTPTYIWKTGKKVSSLTASLFYSHSHFVANGLYCFLSDVMNIRVK